MCIFCEISEKKRDAYVVFEDNDKIAILDAFPVTEGHILVMPKSHFKRAEDVPEKLWCELFLLSKKLAEASKKNLDCQGVNIATAPAAIPHFHIHVIPRYDFDLMGPLADLDNKRERSKKIMEDIYKRFRGS